MRSLSLLLLSAVLAFCASLAVAGLFLPVYSLFEGGTHSCLAGGLAQCLSWIPLSALFYGPLFSIVGVALGTPLVMTILACRA